MGGVKRGGPQVEVAAAYVDRDGKILLLQNSSHKSEGAAWGVPAGKFEEGETPLQAVKRELCEETGLDLPEKDFSSLGALYISKPHVRYVYHLFSVSLIDDASVQFCAEHSAYKWASKEEMEKLILMEGAQIALDVYYKRLQKKGD
ncbi:MAG: NUDIX hydrolase [Chlamydiales bacterium]|nr:NUDIX hydrolase [Chlamydiales bacterium]